MGTFWAKIPLAPKHQKEKRLDLFGNLGTQVQVPLGSRRGRATPTESSDTLLTWNPDVDQTVKTSSETQQFMGRSLYAYWLAVELFSRVGCRLAAEKLRLARGMGRPRMMGSQGFAWPWQQHVDSSCSRRRKKHILEHFQTCMRVFIDANQYQTPTPWVGMSP